MQYLFSRIIAILFTASLLSHASAAPPPEPTPPPTAVPAPAEVPPKGPTRPDRSLKFRDRPSIPFSELHFANDDLRRRAEHFHNQADALVAKKGRADRYKDATHSDNPWYIGGWTVIEDVQGVGLWLHGKTVDGIDQFHEIEAMGRADVGQWWAEVRLTLGADPRRDFETITAILRPVTKPNQLAPQTLEPFSLNARSMSVDLEEGHLHYRLFVNLPHSKDAERNARLMYGSPEMFHKLVSEDLESLRKLAKQSIAGTLTVYDKSYVSSAEPPRPMSVEKLTPETRAKVEAAIDACIDADFAVLKTDFRDMHAAVQLALPRELFDSTVKPGQ
jgi:hypothetical protein